MRNVKEHLWINQLCPLISQFLASNIGLGIEVWSAFSSDFSVEGQVDFLAFAFASVNLKLDSRSYEILNNFQQPRILRNLI